MVYLRKMFGDYLNRPVSTKEMARTRKRLAIILLAILICDFHELYIAATYSASDCEWYDVSEIHELSYDGILTPCITISSLEKVIYGARLVTTFALYLLFVDLGYGRFFAVPLLASILKLLYFVYFISLYFTFPEVHVVTAAQTLVEIGFIALIGGGAAGYMVFMSYLSVFVLRARSR